MFDLIPRTRSGLLRIAIIGATLCWVTGASSQEQPQGPRLSTSGWSVSCLSASSTADLICEATYSLTLESSNEVFANLFVSPLAQNGDDPRYALRFQLPHGVRIPQGVSLMIDEAPPVQATIQTSGPAGLFARTELTPGLRTLLETGETMTVSFDAMSGETLSFAVGLVGFSEVIEKMD